MNKILLLLFIVTTNAFAQVTPEISSWIINTTGETGYGGFETNVQQVQYSTNNVYVSCTCIPGYDIGPWQGNPNIPANQNFVYKITRTPQVNSGTAVNTPLGHIGVWINGVSMFNAKDAFSYNNQGVWNQNAIYNEGASFDDCLGHPAPNGEYHHHLNPTCLYDDSNAAVHSPIIGWAFDGFPVYGAYGFANVDGSGGIKRMESSYQIRDITDRTTLPCGATASQAGPSIDATNPLSKYIEDFEYINGLGDLDEHNGRISVTPEYPTGTYAYFVTLDSNLIAAYPYTLALTYYGLVPAGNTGPGSGHNTIDEQVTTYLVGIDKVNDEIEVTVFPNPTSDYIRLYVSPSFNNNLKAELYNSTGQLISLKENLQPAVVYDFNLSQYANGVYFIRLQTGDKTTVKQLTKD